MNKHLEFFKKAFPEPTERDYQTQIGVLVEEFSELLETISFRNEDTNRQAISVVHRLKSFADHLKSDHDSQVRMSPTYYSNAQQLKEICDVGVVLQGVAYMRNYDLDGAQNAVADSNLSKFDDDGNPIFSETRKVLKSKNYKEPELEKFTGKK